MSTSSASKGTVTRCILTPSRFLFDRLRGVPLGIPLLLVIQTFWTLFVLMRLVDCTRSKSNLRLCTTSFENDNILKIENLTKKYRKAPKPALHAVSFDIKQGSFVFLLGPNGAGKSTLINVLGDVVPKSGGVVSKFAAEKLAICYHENSLYDHLTVTQNLDVFGDLFESQRKPPSNPRQPTQHAHEPDPALSLQGRARAQFVAGQQAQTGNDHQNGDQSLPLR